MRKIMLGLVALTLAACGGDSTGPIAGAVGTWNLKTLDGSPLPFTTAFNAGPPVFRQEIAADAWVLSSNGTWTESMTTRDTNGSTVTSQTTAYNGTWSEANGAVTITSPTRGTIIATITGNSMIYSAGADIFVYARQ